MIKTLAIAALTTGLLATVPVAPAQAQTFGPNCLLFPLLQADCREAIRDGVGSIGVEVREAASAPRPDLRDPTPGPRLVWWWAQDCEAAPAGSGHLLDC